MQSPLFEIDGDSKHHAGGKQEGRHRRPRTWRIGEADHLVRRTPWPAIDGYGVVRGQSSLRAQGLDLVLLEGPANEAQAVYMKAAAHAPAAISMTMPATRPRTAAAARSRVSRVWLR
jgi:hypothetical protein